MHHGGLHGLEPAVAIDRAGKQILVEFGTLVANQRRHRRSVARIDHGGRNRRADAGTACNGYLLRAVPVGQQRRWRGLVFRVRACETTATDEPMRDSVAYLEIFSQPRARDGAVDPRRVFQGWVFASSPALSGLEHPLYDAWVISCQAEAPSEA